MVRLLPQPELGPTRGPHRAAESEHEPVGEPVRHLTALRVGAGTGLHPPEPVRQSCHSLRAQQAYDLARRLHPLPGFEGGHKAPVPITDLQDTGVLVPVQAQFLVDALEGPDDVVFVGLACDQCHHVVAQRFSLRGSCGECRTR